MAPLIRDQLPILKQLIKWFTKEGVIIDSFIFRLHHQVSSFVILVGFVFTVIENYLDSKSILCHNNGVNKASYAHSYCWLHGTSYIKNYLQGVATGCYVNHTRIDVHEDALITAYYLWLPYLLSFLFTLAKLPHSLWKRHFENNLIACIIAGIEAGSKTPKENNSQNKSGNNNNQKGEDGNKGNEKGNEKRRIQPVPPKQIAYNFMEFRHRFKTYHMQFCLLESLNIFTLLLSILITHWILNYKFLYYGVEVLNYLTIYGEYYRQGKNLHNPMCELFPTEVACTINAGSSAGYPDQTNYLCILSNNLFNQRYFFILWMWWVFLLTLSIVGLMYRVAKIAFPQFARLGKVYYGNIIMPFNPSDCFVLELLVRNLNYNPRIVREFFMQLEDKHKEPFNQDVSKLIGGKDFVDQNVILLQPNRQVTREEK